ncbi:helix-turn-helix transcriptional regulator [bacterium]|nr:MAG: helix-turn-helix transcriptional regulator [bacterium]
MIVIRPESELIDRIYEASVVPTLWPGVLQRFADATDSREGVMIATNRDQLKWLVSSPAAEEFVQENYKHVGGMERTRRLLMRSDPAFVTDRDLFSERELTQLPVYRDYLFPSGYGRGVATAISLPDESQIIFHAEGDYRDGRYGSEVIEQLNLLRPHLARSAMIAARLAFERAKTAVETLASLGYPACAVGRAGKVLVANAEFEDTSDRWRAGMGDKIALVDPRANRELSGAIASTVAGHNVRSIAVRAENDGLPAALYVIPVRRSAHDLFSEASAILVLATATNDSTRETALLQALFGLTPAEASIAARIAAGQTIERIAVADLKSAETVRHQLKSTMGKTGCKRQVDLARLIISLIPPRM